MNLIDLRRQLHAAWTRFKQGRGTSAGYEVASRAWREAASDATDDALVGAVDGFESEHVKVAGRNIGECDPLTCPYGS